MKNTKTLIGTIITQDIPQISSLLTGLGFDFIFIDLEHGNISDNTIASIIISKTENSQVFIRLRAISEANIKHALDLGCDGIIAPRVQTIEELKTLVDYSYYPPIGKRSVGFSLANKFGLNLNKYNKQYKPTLLAQIESMAGLYIAEDIISHQSIDGIFMGPYDLSMSMGIPSEFDNPLFLEAIQKIRKHCKTHNKLFGTFAINLSTASKEITYGSDLIAIGIDSHILMNTYEDILKVIKK